MARTRTIYIIYCIILVVASGLIIPSLVKSDSAQLPVVTTMSYPVNSLRFYSGSVPIEASTFIQDWFERRGIPTADTNFSVRDYSESLSVQSGETDRAIVFYVDLKQPHVTYKVFMQVNLSTHTDPFTYITCAEGAEQHGDATLCDGMTQI